MDGITEPVVLVLGHPIAGNPAQFALERAFEGLNLSWRVLSCDVPHLDLQRAIDGAWVLGFRGVLLDQNLVHGEVDIATVQSPALTNQLVAGCDLYFREQDSAHWSAVNALSLFLQQAVKSDAAIEPASSDLDSPGKDPSDEPSSGDGPEAETIPAPDLLCIGPPHTSLVDLLTPDTNISPIAWASPEAIRNANIIALTQQMDLDNWPACDEAKLVIDLANPPNAVEEIQTLGYQVVGRETIRIGILRECIQRWTAENPDIEVLTEAVEEYLAL